MRSCFVVPVSLVIGFSAVAQETEKLPLPIASRRAVQPGTIEPLSPRGKLWLAVKSTFGPADIGNRLLLAGIDQWADYPEEWPQGMEGYGRRFGLRFGRSAIRHGLVAATDIALKTDSRYDLCDCVGFRARTWHAWRRVLVTRRDNGGEMLSMSRLVGAYVTPAITDQWLPDRLNTTGHKLAGGSTYLAWAGVGNMVKEFWPDIKTRVFRRK